jgi:3-(3-hydroxy-phenyl)propionate hydroxylase
VHVCDRLDGVYEIPRAIALDHEMMRVFQQLGIVDAVLPYHRALHAVRVVRCRRPADPRMTMVAPPYPQGYTPSLVFTQPPVERVLRERVGSCRTCRWRWAPR